MAYIDTSSWIDMKVVPLEGETFMQFYNRVHPSIAALCPYRDPQYINDSVVSLWADHALKETDEVVVYLRREKETYTGSSYTETWWGDWKVSEILAASKDGVIAPEMTTAGSGDVFKIAKTAQDQQLVFGWANVAIDETGQFPLDWDGDFTTPEELEKAAYEFVLKYRVTGENHEGEAKGQLVESVMFTKEKQASMGIPEGVLPEGWWVGFHIPDAEVFKKIKSGEYSMFSVEGSAVRKPVT